MGAGTLGTVLVVENEDDVAESLLTVLDGTYDVRRAVSGGEAIASEREFDDRLLPS